MRFLILVLVAVVGFSTPCQAQFWKKIFGKKAREEKRLEDVRNRAEAVEKRVQDSLATTIVYLDDDTASAGAPTGPQALYNHTSYAFGTVQQGEPVKHLFSVQNIGTEPVYIKEVTPSCGCTVASYTREAILPGHSGDIMVTFSTNGKLGPQMKHIFVTTNDPDDEGKAMLLLKGEVKGVPSPPPATD